MKLVINLKLDFQQDVEKAKPTKVAPYVRVRNGKKRTSKRIYSEEKGTLEHITDQLRLMSNLHLIANERYYSKE